MIIKKKILIIILLNIKKLQKNKKNKQKIMRYCHNNKIIKMFN